MVSVHLQVKNKVLVGRLIMLVFNAVQSSWLCGSTLTADSLKRSKGDLLLLRSLLSCIALPSCMLAHNGASTEAVKGLKRILYHSRLKVWFFRLLLYTLPLRTMDGERRAHSHLNEQPIPSKPSPISDAAWAKILIPSLFLIENKTVGDWFAQKIHIEKSLQTLMSTTISWTYRLSLCKSLQSAIIRGNTPIFRDSCLLRTLHGLPEALQHDEKESEWR